LEWIGIFLSSHSTNLPVFDSIENTAEGQCDERRALNAQKGRNIFQVWQFYISVHSKAIIMRFI
jgi:hypothetical protein